MRMKLAVCLSLSLSSVFAAPAFSADTLHVWARYGNNERGTIEAMVKEFTQQTGVKVDLFLANSDFETRLARSAASRKLPDVVLTDATSMGQMNEMGILESIDKDSVKGGDALYDVAWDGMRAYDGKYYGVPFSAQAFAVFVRKDWREKLGLKKPKTWEDLYQLAKAFTEMDPNGSGKADTYGYVMPLSTTRGYASWFMSDLIWQAGGKFLTSNPQGFKASLATPQVKSAMLFAQKMICNGYAQPAAITSTTGDATPVFNSGQAGIYRSGPYHLNSFYNEPGKDKIEVIVPPAGPVSHASLAEGTAAYILAGNKDTRESSKKFLEFLISEKGQKMGMGEGIQGNSLPIVRLSVNQHIDTRAIYKDANWDTFAEQYANGGVYFPAVPNWKPIRQITSDGFNKILSSCSTDIMNQLKDIDTAVNNELRRQGVLAQ
ncbi:ABC transporter substrate-binding protein [Vibrio quintilis]|uniref:Lipoprotein LipO n=1 Tax=Vibrio quintilis TaxID=1117707 RepID=A0A1M7YPY6_9VIBR|nr:sugar ABC transporter substrate-binding protein [Vibrio quintilis]SHO54635.1 Lipoprotein LipO precursor [Vibrio quintilis]